MASGTLTQEQANEMATSFAEELGNLSEGEKQRIFAMERAGVPRCYTNGKCSQKL